jgi:hypothetical protein
LTLGSTTTRTRSGAATSTPCARECLARALGLGLLGGLLYEHAVVVDEYRVVF